MRYQEVKQAVLSVLENSPQQSIFLIGAPGVAKTSLCYDVAKARKLPSDRVLLFRPSLREPCDLMGIPGKSKRSTSVWLPPDEFYEFRDGTGPGMIIWDELPQGVPQMQNAIAGCLLDKVLGPLAIDKDVIQIATGNRTSDKAGANRIVSQLGNRVIYFDMEPHLDDWCAWARNAGIKQEVIGFIRARPDLLHDFNPDRRSNPTQRSWEMVSRSCDLTLPESILFGIVKGLIGESAAIEFVAFTKMLGKVTTFDQVMLSPDKAAVPDHPAILFVTIAGLAYNATKQAMATLMTYIKRVPLEYQVCFMKDAFERNNEIAQTKEFTQWCMENGDVFKS